MFSNSCTYISYTLVNTLNNNHSEWHNSEKPPLSFCGYPKRSPINYNVFNLLLLTCLTLMWRMYRRHRNLIIPALNERGCKCSWKYYLQMCFGQTLAWHALPDSFTFVCQHTSVLSYGSSLVWALSCPNIHQFRVEALHLSYPCLPRVPAPSPQHPQHTLPMGFLKL